MGGPGNVTGERRDGEAQRQREPGRGGCGRRHAAAVGDPRAARPDRHQVRLRRRPVRRLHGACRRRRDALLRAAASAPSTAEQKIVTIEGLSPDGSHPVQKAWLALDVPQCGYCQSGMIMAAAALLAAEPEADRRRHRRRDDQHLPLRHLQPRARRRSSSPPTAARSARLRDGASHDMTIRSTSPAARFLAGSAAAARRPSRSASTSRSAAGRRAARRGAAGGQRLGGGEARRHRGDPHRPLRDGPGHADRPRPARRRGTRMRLVEGHDRIPDARPEPRAQPRLGQLLDRRQPRHPRVARLRPQGRRRGAHHAGPGRGRTAGACRPRECRAANSVITHAPSGRTTTYGKVADAAAQARAAEGRAR